MSPKKLDPYNFCIEYGKLLTEQESNILRCCLGEESTCELRPELESIDFTQWTKLSPSKKINVRELKNIIVDEKKYQMVIQYKQTRIKHFLTETIKRISEKLRWVRRTSKRR